MENKEYAALILRWVYADEVPAPRLLLAYPKIIGKTAEVDTFLELCEENNGNRPTQTQTEKLLCNLLKKRRILSKEVKEPASNNFWGNLLNNLLTGTESMDYPRAEAQGYIPTR